MVQVHELNILSRAKAYGRSSLIAKLRAGGRTLPVNSRQCLAFIEDDTGNVDEIVVPMQKMAWYARCTIDDSNPMIYKDGMDERKEIVLQGWVDSGIDREIYDPVRGDLDTDDRPPSSLWEAIDQLHRLKLNDLAIHMLCIAYSKPSKVARLGKKDSMQEQDII